jgi:hypothetical protein
MKVNLKPNEVVIRAGNSNFRHTDQVVLGKLIVTNQRIYFKTVHEEFRFFDREITPDQILELIFFNTRWLIPNGLSIRTRSGDELPFVVSNRSEWARLITKMF